VLICSALEGTGIAEVWAAIEDRRLALARDGGITRRRAGQARAWLWSEIDQALGDAFRVHPGVAARIAEIEAEVMNGHLTPRAAARRLLAIFLGEDGLLD